MEENNKMASYSIESIKTNLPELKAHPVVKLPMMSEEKLKGLEMDILMNGQRTPVWIIDEMIFDGRSKYKVLQQLREKGLLTFVPDIQEWSKSENENLENTLLSLNMHRNNYSSQQRAAYAARYLLDSLRDAAEQRMIGGAKIPDELIPEGQKGKATAIAAMLVGSNEKYVQECSKIKNMNEHFLDFIIEKKMAVLEGLEFITLSMDNRNFLYSQMKNGMQYKDALSTFQHENQEDTQCNGTNESTKVDSEKARKKHDKDLLDVPTVIFTFPADEQLQELVSNLICKHYSDREQPFLATWDAHGDPMIATKVANVARYINKKVTDE